MSVIGGAVAVGVAINAAAQAEAAAAHAGTGAAQPITELLAADEVYQFNFDYAVCRDGRVVGRFFETFQAEREVTYGVFSKHTRKETYQDCRWLSLSFQDSIRRVVPENMRTVSLAFDWHRSTVRVWCVKQQPA